MTSRSTVSTWGYLLRQQHQLDFERVQKELGMEFAMGSSMGNLQPLPLLEGLPATPPRTHEIGLGGQ